MSTNGQKQINSFQAGGNRQGLNFGQIRSFRIPLPPTLREQQLIAEALSEVDEELAALDAALAKKRDLKQGAMQELLTGQTRLPGFSEAWKVKRLEEIADIDPENLSSNTDPDYLFNYISLEDVDAGTLHSYTEQTFRDAPSRARRIVRKNDVLISTVRPNLKSHLFIKDDVKDFICSTGFSVIRVYQESINPFFVYSHLFANEIETQINALIAGSNYPAINSNDVRRLQIPIPMQCDEQTAIAAILSEMDAEINILEAQRQKTADLKQGMMQELLTGKTRLI